MTSDVKFSHYFLLMKVIKRDAFLILKSFRKQFQSTTHSVNVGKLLRFSTYHCKLYFYFIYMFWSLNCNMDGYHHKYFSMDMFYNNFVTRKRRPMMSNAVKNSWNWNFAYLRDLGLSLLEAATGDVLSKNCS